LRAEVFCVSPRIGDHGTIFTQSVVASFNSAGSG